MRIYRSPSVLCVAKSNLKYANDGYDKAGLMHQTTQPTIGDVVNTGIEESTGDQNKLMVELWNDDGHGSKCTTLPIEY